MAAHPHRRDPAPTQRFWPKDEARFRALLQDAGTGPLNYVALLGLDVVDFPTVLEAIDRGLPYRVFDQLLANTGLDYEELVALVGIPRRTLTRRKQAGRFDPIESDRLLRAARVFRAALALTGDDREAAVEWLRSRPLALGGAVPLHLARTEVGARQVETLIGQLEHGVFP